MLNDFTWNMTGYIPKYQVNPHGDGIIPYVAERIFQLEPEPPSVGNLNEYILSALHEKNLLHFSFFLHHYEPQLNKRIKSFLGVDGGDLYDTDRFLDIKLSCREQMLQKLMDYDPAKGAEYATYIFPFIRDAMLRFRMGEEKWSVSSLTNYKMVRSMAWLYHNTKDAVNEFSKKYNCDLALAEEYLKVVRGIRNQQPFYVTDEDGEETGEDVALDDSWNYTDILWNGIQAEKVQRAFEKLNYREQTLLEKRLAICMTCGRVGSWKNRPTFEDLAVMFEGSTASGAERAYRKAMDKLTELLVAEGAIHAVRLKQKSKTKRKKKITAAIYEYQADCDGEWGEISVDFENGTAEIIRLADWDTIKTNWFANEAIRYILSLSPDALKKYMLVPLEAATYILNPYNNCKWYLLCSHAIILLQMIGGIHMKPILNIENLTKIYGNVPSQTKALNGITFQVMPGEFLGIMGSSGSGKSTLLNCIATVIQPTGGSIQVEGDTLQSLKGKALAEYRGKKVGYLFQNFELLDNLTGRENILLPTSLHGVSEAESSQRLKQLADYLEITDVLDKFPSKMSGGQRQRVAAARALILHPQMILADEPTGALDSKNARSLMEKLSGLNRDEQATILMVTHDSNAASFCKRILFIQDGVIFHELRRGDESQQEFYGRILKVMAQLGGGSANVL